MSNHNRKQPPFFAGGQGRSGRDISSDGSAIFFTIAALILVAVVLILRSILQ